MRSAELIIRPHQPSEIEAIKALTISAFEGVTLEQNVEAAIGLAADHDWRVATL